MLANEEPVPNGLTLFAVDVPNNEDVVKDGVVFVNKAEPVDPNIVVLVDDVNGLELAAGVLLNEVLNSEVLVAGLEANRLLENGFGVGFGVGWLNGLFGVFNDGKIGATA